MTARAMKGDRERCLAAGMDGYISKPIDAAQLFAEIRRFTAGAEVDATEPGSGTAGGSEPGVAADVFDLSMALERCCQSRELLSELVACLFTDDERLFPQMYAALERDDFSEIDRLAHRLRGTLVCLAAQPAIDAATDVERDARDCDAKTGEAMQILEAKVAALKAALRNSNCPEPRMAANTSVMADVPRVLFCRCLPVA